MKREEYLTLLTEQIRCRMARPGIEAEISDHIEDQTRVYMSEGMERQEAEEAAVRDMGDPVDVGVELDKVHRPSMPWGMIGLILVLSIAGYLFQWMIQRRIFAENGDTFFNPSRQFVLMAVGIVLMIMICFADYTRIADRARELFLLLVVGCAAGMSLFGLQINSFRQWIALPGGSSLNIPLLLMLTVPLYAAILYRYRGQGGIVLLKAVLWMMPVGLLVLNSWSLWMGAMLAISYVIVLAAAVWRNWFRLNRKVIMGILVGTAVLLPTAGAAWIMAFFKNYQQARLLAMFRPMLTFLNGEDAVDVSYMTDAVRAMLDGSRAVGESTSVLSGDRIPNPSELILTQIAAYYGVLVAAVITGLLIFLFLRFLRVSLKQRNQLGLLMGTGCAVIFLIHTAVYILNNLGLTYLGSFCPFLGYGGTGGLVMYILLGVMLSICRYKNTASEKMYEANSVFLP